MRQQHLRKPLVILGFVVFEPDFFGAVKPGRMALPTALIAPLSPPSWAVISSHSATVGVAPEFRRANDFAFGIEGNEAVLLATDADGFDFAADGLGLAEGLADSTCGSIAPCVGVLFLRAGRQVGQQVVSLRS